MAGKSAILVAGAINTDLVATMTRAPDAGETITGTSFAIYGGGKGANQAVAAAKSGAQVTLLGAVGDDDFGRARLADLAKVGVDTTGVQTLSGDPSGVALILVEEHGENRIAYVPGATMRVSAEHAGRTAERIDPGFLLATNELPRAVLQQVFRQVRERGGTVMFNATPEPGTARDLLSIVDILVVNEGEGRALAGSGPIGPTEMVNALAGEFGCTVVMTLGADGVLAAAGGETIRVGAHQVEAVDTTGAGDTFCGALAASLAWKPGLESAIEYGVAAAALSVSKAGAQASIPARDAIEAMLARAN